MQGAAFLAIMPSTTTIREYDYAAPQATAERLLEAPIGMLAGCLLYPAPQLRQLGSRLA